MSRIEVLQVVVQPVFYAAYTWMVATIIMIGICVTSKVVEAIQLDWEQVQRQKTYRIILSTSFEDLHRIAKQYELVFTQERADLVAAVYNFYIQQQVKRQQAIVE